MSKVIVNNEMALALERVFERGSKSTYGREKYLIYNYIVKSFAQENKILMDLSLEDITKIALTGYEVDITPEEIIFKKYKSLNNEKVTDLELGFMNGIEFTLKQLGHKIKGVND